MAEVTFLVELVKEVIIAHKDQISGAETEFKLLENELNLIEAFLMDIAARKKKDHIYRELERQIREAMCEVEDTIDNSLVQAAKTKRTFCGLRVSSSKRFYLAKKVKSIREEQLHPLIEKVNADFAILAHLDKDEFGGMEDHRTKLKRVTSIYI